MNENPLEISDLTVAYRDVPVLRRVTLALPPGHLVAVVGPNGAGKSTMIKAVLGLVPALAGTVRLFGRPYAEVRRRVGYVPQRSSVDWDFPTHALDVVLMGLYGRLGWLRRPGRRRETALRCLERSASPVCRAPDQPAVRRPAAACVPRARWPRKPTST
jgi:manganese/zinc/iron transport system ATP- binding protein